MRMIETKGIIVLIDCSECNAKISDSAASCPHCGAIALDPSRSLPVEVFNVDMKVSTMFMFFLKAAFAAVPAIIVIYTAWTVIGGLLAPVFHL
jgi:ribosomal protein L40E